jgi:hypothetical protein
MDPIVREALDAAAHGDWTVLRLKLHPYVHWETADGDTLRGRNRVMAMLHEEPSLRPPAANLSSPCPSTWRSYAVVPIAPPRPFRFRRRPERRTDQRRRTAPPQAPR